MKFKKTKINTKGFFKDREVDAWQLGDWAYHKQRISTGEPGPFLSITHIPTGLKIPDSYTRTEAREKTKLLAENVSEWHPTKKQLDSCIQRNKWPKKFREQCQKVMNGG